MTTIDVSHRTSHTADTRILDVVLVALGTLSRNSQVVSLDFLLDSECHVTLHVTPLKPAAVAHACMRKSMKCSTGSYGVAASPCRGRGVTALSVVARVQRSDGGDDSCRESPVDFGPCVTSAGRGPLPTPPPASLDPHGIPRGLITCSLRIDRNPRGGRACFFSELRNYVTRRHTNVTNSPFSCASSCFGSPR